MLGRERERERWITSLPGGPRVHGAPRGTPRPSGDDWQENNPSGKDKCAFMYYIVI